MSTQHPVRALIDFAQPDPANGAPSQRLSFAQPVRELVAHALDEVAAVLESVETAARAGQWCVGWVAYEAAAAFDPALRTHAPLPGTPLAWFGVFEAPQGQGPEPLDPELRIDWQHLPARAAFEGDVATVKAAIAEGRCYQVNLTAACIGQLHGSPRALFAALQQAQPGGYAACIEVGAHSVVSVSPELFFDWQAGPDGSGELLTRPMKGTAPRGSTPADDAAQAQQLRASPKERAENVMIVDLLRNDLSRIAQPFSVQVPQLFALQALPAVWQMTSDVRARSRMGTRLVDVFRALFPCGSVTGAPKVEAMRLIQQREAQARGVYCGAVGWVRPAGEGQIAATFNVPIRTAELQGEALRCSVGSGLVADAQPAAEWAEWQHKRAFIARVSEPFELLETLALDEGVLRHLDLHLARLQAAAQHFNRPWPEQQIADCLNSLAAQHPAGVWRLRLTLDAQGQVDAQAAPLLPTPTPVRLQLATSPLAEADSEFVRFKTTRRAHYSAFAPAAGSGVFDTILHNPRGEITETTFGNIAMQLADGRWVTPPQRCGLLPGVGRQLALQQGRLHEQVVHLDDLHQVKAWAFVNSLRGWLPAQCVSGTP